MKTAMQELIEDLQKEFGNILVEDAFIPFLEKEKQQLVDAHTAACEMNYGDIDSDIIDLKGEEYYNQNYNQNK